MKDESMKTSGSMEFNDEILFFDDEIYDAIDLPMTEEPEKPEAEPENDLLEQESQLEEEAVPEKIPPNELMLRKKVAEMTDEEILSIRPRDLPKRPGGEMTEEDYAFLERRGALNDRLYEEKIKRERKENFNLKKEILHWVLVVVAAMAIAFVFNNYVIINARVVSGSMENTIMTGARVLGSRWSFLYSDPERGDIVIFYSEEYDDKILIKRVIGLPGEEVYISGGKVFIDGVSILEDYLLEPMLDDCGPFIVPEGCYFMLGDNRNDSNDSRHWNNPYVPREDLIGRAMLVYWPDLYMLN